MERKSSETAQKVKEDTAAHERLGMRVDDKGDSVVNLDEHGAITDSEIDAFG